MDVTDKPCFPGQRSVQEEHAWARAFKEAIGEPVAHRITMDHLHAFAHKSGAPAGADVIAWFAVRTAEATAAANAALRETPPSGDGEAIGPSSATGNSGTNQ